MCRWEPIVVRPTPQRPPIEAISATANATIEALSARIATLEQALTRQQHGATSGDDSSPNLTGTPSGSQTPEFTPEPSVELSLSAGEPSGTESEERPHALINHDVQVAAVALAQLSLAPKAEYVGSGTVLCALHRLGDPDSSRFPHPKTMLTSPVLVTAAEVSNHHSRAWEILSDCTTGLAGTILPFSEGAGPSAAKVTPIRRLVAKLPPREQVEQLLDSFFTERNWQFGIPYSWFRSSCEQMWAHLDLRCQHGCRGGGDCPACRNDINPHWLGFLFSVLALAPGSRNTAKNCARYFVHALTARRLVEDILLVTPVYSTSEGTVHGGVLSCYSAVLLAMYLVDRGRVSEAWKLIGSALRHAQALGLHRDPGWKKWEEMQPIDRELRITSWWLLMVSDRMWSFVLGRPPMVPKNSFDIRALPSDTSSDGSPNPCAAYHKALIALSEVIADTMDKCLGLRAPPYAAVLQMDQRFQEWEARLPDKLRWRRTSAAPSPSGAADTAPPDTLNYASTIADRGTAYQRHILAGWHLSGVMNLHRPYLMHPPPVLPPPGVAPGPRTKQLLNPSRQRCIDAAFDITRVMCGFHSDLTPWREPGRLNSCLFAYFLFDGAVALAGALSQTPPHPRSQEYLTMMDRTMYVLGEDAKQAAGALDGEGEMAKRAMVVLKALRKAGSWDKRQEEKGELVLLQDMLAQEQRQAKARVQAPHSMNFPRGAADFYSHAGPMPSAPYPTHNHMFATQPTANSASNTSYIPYLGSQAYPAAHSSTFTDTVGHGFPNGSSMRSFAPLSSGLGDIDMSIGTFGIPPAGMRPAQSMVIPFDVLQGVQPGSDGMHDLALDWVKLAGMEGWYTESTANGGSGV